MENKVVQIEFPLLKEVMEKLGQVEKKVDQLSKQSPLEDTWLDNQEVAKLLKVTPRTLQSWRNQRILPFSQVSSKLYYKASDVQAFLEAHHIRSTERRGV